MTSRLQTEEKQRACKIENGQSNAETCFYETSKVCFNSRLNISIPNKNLPTKYNENNDDDNYVRMNFTKKIGTQW